MKNISLAEIRTGVPSISKHALYQLSYRNLVKKGENFLILPQTSDQYWSTLVFLLLLSFLTFLHQWSVLNQVPQSSILLFTLQLISLTMVLSTFNRRGIMVS